MKNSPTKNNCNNCKARSFFISLALLFLFTTDATATVLSNWPDWDGGKRRLEVFITTGGVFATDVRACIADWNTANAGNNWNLVETTNRANAEIIICENNPGAGNTGLATPYTHATGLFGLGSGALDSVDVKVKPGLSSAERKRTIIHELGHCMRLAHTPGATDVLNRSNTATTPSANDIAEALASDEDPPCPFAAARNAAKNKEKQISLVPKVGAGVNLENLLKVNIQFLTGDDVFVDPASIEWGPTGINAVFVAGPTAEHNEVFRLELIYEDRDTLGYTGVLTVTEDEAPEGKFPHAVAGNDTIVDAGTPVVLDGSQSYHDDPSVFFSGSWMTTLVNDTFPIGIFAETGELKLPTGKHIAVLQIMDYYGQTSNDTINITVREAPIPTDEDGGGMPTFLKVIIFLILAGLTGGLIRSFTRNRNQSDD